MKLPKDRTALRRLERAVSSLSLAPERVARTSLEARVCCLCTHEIFTGDDYRDRGKHRQAHSACVAAVAAELK